MKSVLILGASYAGNRAAEVLAESLPPNYRIILIDQSSHFQHLYKFSRYGVIEGYESKAFIPRDAAFAKSPTPRHHHQFVHARVTKITDESVFVQRIGSVLGKSARENRAAGAAHLKDSLSAPERFDYDYLIYALGSNMPRPLQALALNKPSGVKFLQEQQKTIKRAKSILCVGGGALGIQYATDIAHRYPEKTVTLVHSRNRLLSQFDEQLHHESLEKLENLGVRVILGDRVILPQSHVEEGKELLHRTLYTLHGRTIETDLQLFCTGQTPNTKLLSDFVPEAIDAHGFIQVERTLQVVAAPPNVFACGDCIDGFGAIKAGHVGWNQATIAANNILKLIQNDASLEDYQASLPMIKLTTSLTTSISQLVNEVGQLEITKQVGLDEDDAWKRAWSMLGVDALHTEK